MPGIERRTFTAPLELEERSDAPAVIKGHAAVFNSKSEDLGFFREILRPGAFSNVLQDPDTRSLINHDDNLVLGRVGSKTLRLSEDQRGLYQETDPPDTSYANDLLVVMRRGDVNQQSFGFTVDTDNWRVENGEQIREVISVKRLFDVSVVTFPAYRATDAQVRNFMQAAALDFEGLSAAFVKHHRGLDLTTADRDVIRQTVAVLTEAIKDAPQARSDQPAPDAAAQESGLEVMRQRLWLAANS